MWQLARTPRWIGALVLALAVAAGFAALGHWQLSRAIESGKVVVRPTETVVPLESIAVPQHPMTANAALRMVTIDGSYVRGSGTLLEGRLNDGRSGYWVMGQMVTQPTGASLAVALGWTPREADAKAAASEVGESQAPVTLVGRYVTGEDPTQGDYFQKGQQRYVSVAALINEWPSAPKGVYGGYVTSSVAPAGLDVIASPKPSNEVTLNWLNVFYAIEWVVFAGLAVFMWYRLLRDAHERQLEEAAELS